MLKLCQSFCLWIITKRISNNLRQHELKLQLNEPSPMATTSSLIVMHHGKESGRAGLGFVAPNARGDMLLSGAKAECYASSPLEAEAKSLLWATNQAHNKGYSKIIFDSDSLCLVNTLQREGNKVAHSIAAWALICSDELILEGLMAKLAISFSKKAKLHILKDTSGILKPGRNQSVLKLTALHIHISQPKKTRWLRELLHNNDKQELVSREKKDRHEYEHLADLASKLRLHSHLYVKALRPFVVYYTFGLEALQSPDQVSTYGKCWRLSGNSLTTRAREIVRLSRHLEPDDLFDSAITGFGTGALLGRLQGQVVFLMRSVTRLGLPIVGTGIDEKKNSWFKWPEWLPIQVLDEEAQVAKRAREENMRARFRDMTKEY
ncbi:reverse transcriptase [Tanacetum coccineum]